MQIFFGQALYGWQGFLVIPVVRVTRPRGRNLAPSSDQETMVR